MKRKKEIEDRLIIELRQNQGDDFGDWYRNLSKDEKYVFDKMWERDSQKPQTSPTYRTL